MPKYVYDDVSLWTRVGSDPASVLYETALIVPRKEKIDLANH